MPENHLPPRVHQPEPEHWWDRRQVPTNYDEIPINAPDDSCIVWIISPTYEFEGIRVCMGHCDLLNFVDITDATSVKEVLEWGANDHREVLVCWGHGSWSDSTDFMFDEERELFIIVNNSYQGSSITLFSPEEFVLGLGEPRLSAIRRVDIDKIIVHEHTQDGRLITYSFNKQGSKLHAAWFDIENARIGKLAIAIGNEIITDFVYDHIEVCWSGIIIAALDGNYGILDRSGDTILPFIFEDITRISNFSAFAKHGGKYGIIDLRALPSLNSVQHASCW